MANQQERAAALRKQKLEEIEKLVQDGSLVVRQMTPAERKRHPRPKARAPRKSRYSA